MNYNATMAVNYRGKEYLVQYFSTSEFVDVDISWRMDSYQKMRKPLGSASPESVARIAALEILKGARERGELS
jgi:hypothetical protein